MAHAPRIALATGDITVHETHRFLATDDTLQKVIFVSFEAETEALHRRALGLP